MINRKTKQILLSSFFAVQGIATLCSETFRVSKIHIAEIKSEVNFETNEKLGINDSLAVYLPVDKVFLEGIELKMDIPEAIATWIDSVACSVYDRIKPLPSEKTIDYTATREYVRTLPNKLSWILQIPTREENSIKASNYITKMDVIPDISQDVILLRLQPVMKGLPEEISNSIVPITIKPILSNKGQLQINLSSYENELQDCSVFIDDQPTQYSNSNKKLLLTTGIHNVTIISESYRTEVRTVRIDQAKSTNLNIELKSIEPTLLITAPEGTKITFDDMPCNKLNTEFIISEGEHKVRFSIGDYEIIRSISAVKGRTYTANFTLDLEITEH